MRFKVFLLLAALACAQTVYGQTPPTPFLSRLFPWGSSTAKSPAAVPTQPASAMPTQRVSPPPAGTEPANPAQTEARPEAPPIVENLLTFDYRSAELQWADDRWQLIAGGLLVKDFGRRDADAREALRIIRELRLNQLGTVGTPRPILEYWLADGHAPQGLTAGLRPLALDTTSLRVEQVQGQWCLRDAAHSLFNFGTHADEAQQALAVIRKHGFTKVGYVGHLPPVMLIFMADGNSLMTTRLWNGAVPVSRTKMLGKPATGVMQQGGVQPAAFTEVASTDGGAPASPAGPGEPRPLSRDLQRNTVTPTVVPSGRQLATPALPAFNAGLQAERVPFDYRQAQVRKDNQDWKLSYGSYLFASFGQNERDARQALAAFQFYRFTEHNVIGKPKASFSYFLANGQAPRGLMFGVNTQSFQPESLSVRQEGKDWVIADANHVVFHFGDKADDAKQALQAIQKYKFDSLCRIGQADGKTMTFLVRR